MAHHRDLPYSKLMIIVDFSKISITVFFLHISLKLLCIIIQNRKKKISSRVLFRKNSWKDGQYLIFSNFLTLVMFLYFTKRVSGII